MARRPPPRHAVVLLAVVLAVVAEVAQSLPPPMTTTTTTTITTTTASNATDVDEQTLWWQLQSLETGEQLPKWLFESAHQGQQPVPPPAPTTPPQPRLNRAPVVGTMNLAAENGYSAENHTVRTADGFLLTLFRLPNPGKPAVFLAHTLLSSSADFLILGRGKGLPFLLHDAGFDVWLFNARGTTPSRKHEHLQPWQARFWDFSWHEIGILDLPASIDFVLKATGQAQLHYVGFCQGATAFLVMGSERPEYMEKAKSFVALAPVAFLRDIRSFPLRLLAAAPNHLYFLTRLIGLNEFLPNTKFVTMLGEVMCADGEVHPSVCSNIFFLLFGTDTEQMNMTALPDLFANAPAGASTRQLLHYGQLVNHRHLVFRMFDFGRAGNLRVYHTTKPPDYDLSRVTAPTYIFHAANDLLCVQSNIDELARRLPNVAKDGGMRKINHTKFNHIDYLLAKNAKELVYDDVIDIIRKSEASPATPAAPGVASSLPTGVVTSAATPVTSVTPAPVATSLSLSSVATAPAAATTTTSAAAATTPVLPPAATRVR